MVIRASRLYRFANLSSLFATRHPVSIICQDVWPVSVQPNTISCVAKNIIFNLKHHRFVGTVSPVTTPAAIWPHGGHCDSGSVIKNIQNWKRVVKCYIGIEYIYSTQWIYMVARIKNYEGLSIYTHGWHTAPTLLYNTNNHLYTTSKQQKTRQNGTREKKKKQLQGGYIDYH
jgi:hypothetical protein